MATAMRQLRRITFFPSDLQNLNGKSISTCRHIIREIRRVYALQKHQDVTVYHISEYLNLPLELVQSYQLN